MTTDAKRRTAPSSPGGSRGDTNAFFGLGFNILVNVLVLTGLCLGVVQHPGRRRVRRRSCPRSASQLLIGNVYYTYLARRLAAARGPHRRDARCRTGRACRTCSSSSS